MQIAHVTKQYTKVNKRTLLQLGIPVITVNIIIHRPAKQKQTRVGLACRQKALFKNLPSLKTKHCSTRYANTSKQADIKTRLRRSEHFDQKPNFASANF